MSEGSAVPRFFRSQFISRLAWAASEPYLSFSSCRPRVSFGHLGLKALSNGRFDTYHRICPAVEGKIKQSSMSANGRLTSLSYPQTTEVL
jgi:hypothetical protein